MKKTERDAILASGRDYLGAWLLNALNHGTIYYTIPQVARSGMSRRIVLATIVMRNGAPELSTLWPRSTAPDGDDNEALDLIAKDWRFSFKHRAFVIGGCGMNMVFALIDDLASTAGLEGGKYANSVRHEHFG